MLVDRHRGRDTHCMLLNGYIWVIRGSIGWRNGIVANEQKNFAPRYRWPCSLPVDSLLISSAPLLWLTTELSFSRAADGFGDSTRIDEGKNNGEKSMAIHSSNHSPRTSAALNIKQPLTWSEWLRRWRLKTNVDELNMRKGSIVDVFKAFHIYFRFNFSSKYDTWMVNLPRKRFIVGLVFTNLSFTSNSNRSLG